MNTKYRTERDSMGELQVPEEALYSDRRPGQDA
jgi:fumarate hydratase class II